MFSFNLTNGMICKRLKHIEMDGLMDEKKIHKRI